MPSGYAGGFRRHNFGPQPWKSVLCTRGRAKVGRWTSSGDAGATLVPFLITSGLRGDDMSAAFQKK